ncbi:hypothetical protein G6O69_29335 [Pseudenhygromyxa sp. WMMC2535]|uniref:hypothetical protein n=1 Tax=Pseudenhygromyxa sp. WMMC2535 TaxID=2712867 RepID=UPI001552554E|nr:hypothetical protein [Pseudenhygromyxa sp. WMMC2535]NVB41967.1 hypothetical protein [Pseudenhygromyxa sp. WMMC2535]
MAFRAASALLTAVFAPSLALAAPAADSSAVQQPGEATGEATGPEVQTPTAAPEQDTDAASVSPTTEPTTADEAAAAQDPNGASPDEVTPTTAEVDPASAVEPAAEPTREPAPEAEEQDMSNLLASDEQETSRVRISSSERPKTVDRNERLRNYYKSVYRPDHNPSRLYFSTRAAYALASTNETGGGGRMGFINAEIGQTWNNIGYAIGPTLFAGDLTFGEDGVAKYGGMLIGGGPSLGLGRLGLLGRGYLDFRVGYNFFYAPISSTRSDLSDPPDAAPHGPKAQVDVGLLFFDSERRRFRHGFGATIGYQGLFHSLAADYPIVNSFTVGLNYFFG